MYTIMSTKMEVRPKKEIPCYESEEDVSFSKNKSLCHMTQSFCSGHEKQLLQLL